MATQEEIERGKVYLKTGYDYNPFTQSYINPQTGQSMAPQTTPSAPMGSSGGVQASQGKSFDLTNAVTGAPKKQFQELAEQAPSQATGSWEAPKKQFQELAEQAPSQATGSWEAPKTTSMSYSPETGTQTATRFTGQKIFEANQFYGFPSQSTGGSMTTATSQQSKPIFPSFSRPNFREQGAEALPGLFLMGAALTVPSWISLGSEILKTPGEVIQFGPGIVPAKVSRAGTQIYESWTQRPIETATMTAGSMVFTWGLAKAWSVLKTEPLEIIGKTKMDIQPQTDEFLRGRGEGIFVSPKTKTALNVEFESVSKDWQGHDVSLQRGVFESRTMRTGLSKIAGQKVFSIKESSFGEFGVMTDISETIKAGGSVSATGLKDISRAGEISAKVFESQGMDIWQSAVKTKGARMLVRTDMFKNVAEIGSTGAGLFFKSDITTKGFMGSALKISRAAGEIISAAQKSTPLVIPAPTLYKPLAVAKTKELTITLPRVESAPKQSTRAVAALTPAKTTARQKGMTMQLPKEAPSFSVSQLTMQLPKQESKTAQISLQMPAQKQTQKTAELQILSSLQQTTTRTAIPTMKPSIPPAKPIGLFWSPSGGFKGFRMPRMFKRGHQKTRYEPSLGGVLGFAKASRKRPKKMFTGLEIRPIVLGRRK